MANSSNISPPHKRPIGFVFQDANLFEHLTAEGNLRFAMKRADKDQSVISYNEIIQLMNIESILLQYPHNYRVASVSESPLPERCLFSQNYYLWMPP
ncbi:MAG: hypothetical protein ACTJGG_11610 [Marinomonas foliarum]